MPFNFSSPEYLSHHRTRKNRVSPAHMNSPLIYIKLLGNNYVFFINSLLLYVNVPNFFVTGVCIPSNE